MVDVVVAFRDAVMATILAWSGVGGPTDMASLNGGAAKGPAAKPAPVEKVIQDDKKKPQASLTGDGINCPDKKALATSI